MEQQDELDAPEPQLTLSNDPPISYDFRLSLPLFLRVPTAAVIGAVGGFALGASHGGQMAGMRFRAENAHRFPTTSTGWYLYHKTKNYKIAFSSVREGIKMGAKVSFWTSSFFVIEDFIDIERGSKDFVSTAAAGLTVAGLFSAWSTFYIITRVTVLSLLTTLIQTGSP